MKPKFYSRKGNICTCECFIIDLDDKTLDKVMIKYKIKINKDIKHHYYSGTKPHFGEYDGIYEFPIHMINLPISDLSFNTNYFKRDGIYVPFVYSITVPDSNEYLTFKKKEERKKKLKKLKKN